MKVCCTIQTKQIQGNNLQHAVRHLLRHGGNEIPPNAVAPSLSRRRAQRGQAVRCRSQGQAREAVRNVQIRDPGGTRRVCVWLVVPAHGRADLERLRSRSKEVLASSAVQGQHVPSAHLLASAGTQTCCTNSRRRWLASTARLRVSRSQRTRTSSWNAVSEAVLAVEGRTCIC